MPDPVFGPEDRVNPNATTLPAELRGVTDPIKVAEYYQRREANLREEMRRAQPTPPTSRVQITREVQNEPPANPPAQATFSVQEAAAARETLIRAARDTAKQGKKYWDRLKDDIEKLVATLSPEDRVSAGVWETCYNTLVGMNINRLLEEDRAAAETARVASERSAAPASEQPAPPPLPSEVTQKILPGLGITEERYRKAQDQIAKGEWPLTADNINGRVTIGSERR